MIKIKSTIVLLSLLVISGCEKNSSTGLDNDNNSSWTFVVNEGNFGSSDGSISMIDNSGNIYHTDAIGDVVQSLAVYENKLIVLINNSHKIKIFEITENGLNMPGIEVSTNNSSPREMVIVENMVYFTNWNTSDVKIFNLTTYNIDHSIPVGTSPEGIISDGNYLWVANSGGSTISKIDIATKAVESIEVGQGPQNLVKLNDDIYISRTYYSSDWTETYHGATRIGSEITINNYGSGSPCGGSVVNHNNSIYRSFNGGLTRMDNDLNLESTTIGSFTQSQIYHVEKIDDRFWFAITNWNDLNEIHVIDINGNEVAHYQAGQNPGDFAKWTKLD